MRLSDIPAKLAKAWASSAGAGTIHAIPVDSQIGHTDGAASLTDGFVPLNAVPRASGGVPPDIKDFNGILQMLSAWTVWFQSGGAIRYDPAYVALNGGYPLGSILQSSVTIGREFASAADNNVTDPDSAGSANWIALGVRAATQDEVNLGERGDVFVSPATLLGGSTLDTIYHPGGLIQKFGVTPINPGPNVTRTPLIFPTAFPNAFHGISGNADNFADGIRTQIAVMFPGFGAAGGTILVDTGDSRYGIDAGRHCYWTAWGV